MGECLRSANQPIHAGLYKAYVCIFSVLPELEILLFYADGESYLKVLCSKLVLLHIHVLLCRLIVNYIIIYSFLDLGNINLFKASDPLN